MIPQSFSVGALHGWRGVLLGLAASSVFLFAGWQDVGPGIGMTSSAFWFLLALTSTGGGIWLGIGARIWGGALLGVAFFCLETWLVRRWWRRVQPE
jgi:hypothetical protein